MDIDRNIQLLESGELLTEKEVSTFEKIKAAGACFDPQVISRVAGGWVRDKLLGKQSDDIDICIEGCTADDFGLKLSQQFPENTTKIIVLQDNPKQSKFMKTVRVCIFGDTWIDICNLRGEGDVTTPLTDALHRDFSINALFYNITYSKVEDFVGGIPDLKNQVIRTPNDPNLTFAEDSLRIIRAARFHARLGYRYHESIFDAAKSHLADFEEKITKERVVTELTKVIELNGLIDFLDFIINIGFFEAVFDPYHIFSIDPLQAKERLVKVLSRSPPDLICPLALGAIFMPIHNTDRRPDPEHPKHLCDPVEWAICRAMRMPVKSAENANILVQGAITANSVKLTRKEAGHWVRKIGEIWPLAKYLILDDAEFKKCEENLFKFIEDENLSKCYDMKCLINGKDLAKLLGIKPGRGFQKYVDELIDWQLDHPTATKEDYEEYIRNK